LEVDSEQAKAFYRGALLTGLFLDSDGSDRLFDPDADVAWRTYGDDLPLVMRFDYALRNLSMLYPAAFAPGPVFQLPGWYDDDAWGVGFTRPPRDELEALFRDRAAAATPLKVLEESAKHWGVSGHVPLQSAVTPMTQLLVAGSRALMSVVEALGAHTSCDVRSQVVLISDGAGARHLLGIASALRRSSGMPRFLSSEPTPAEVGSAMNATLLVTSNDASASEIATATHLADRIGIGEGNRLSI
jgi:hypothetical protein